MLVRHPSINQKTINGHAFESRISHREEPAVRVDAFVHQQGSVLGGAMFASTPAPKGLAAPFGAPVQCGSAALIAQARGLAKQGRAVEAWNVVNVAVGTYGDARSLAWRGALGRITRRQDFMVDLEEALKRDPNNDLAILNRGAASLFTVSTALESIKGVIRRHPESQFAQYCLAMHYRMRFWYEEAQEILERIVAQNPFNDMVLAALAIEQDDGYGKATIAMAVRALEINPFNGMAHDVLGKRGYPDGTEVYREFSRCRDYQAAPSEIGALNGLPLWIMDDCF